ncbi:MAG: hypothetical protein PUD07_05765 [bacterium]|nr:hypothetical protein [bacterium]
MEKNNKLKIIISSIFLLVIVSTAAFAYFGSFNIDVNNNVAVNILTEDPGEATFVSDATFLNLQVPALNMNPINSNDEIEAAKNEAVLNVTLKGHNNVLTVCSFDIVFEYDLGSNIYGDGATYKTSGADKEITMQVVSNSGTNYYENETNFDFNTSNGWSQKTSTVGAKKVLVSGAQITSTGYENTQNYKFIGKYYNLSLSQSQLEGKSFTGKIYADNLSCDSKEKLNLYKTIQAKYNEGNTFVKLYDGEGSDTYANPVYYYNGAVEDNNVLFGGFCWKIVRTTDTGGVKLIYNGVQTNGSCNNTGTDSQIGTSAFNSSYDSPAYVGYMYNTVYTISYKSSSELSNIVFGNSFTYSDGTYTLADTMTVATWSDGYSAINNNHYTCFTTSTTCSSLYYVYYTLSSNAYYITLTGGKSVGDALNEMLYADDVNKTDSTMKTYIETWYENNMTAYTSYLEDTTYCNDRSILNLNGWNPNGGSTIGSSSYLEFKNYNTNYSLVCGSVTDQFRVGNTKAPLKYPVGLLTAPEVWLAYKDASDSTYYLNTGQNYLLGSPRYFNFFYAGGRSVSSSGSMGSSSMGASRGVRPSVSLKPGTRYISGNGSYTSPYLIE